MKVRFTHSAVVLHANGSSNRYEKGKIYDLPDSLKKHWFLKELLKANRAIILADKKIEDDEEDDKDSKPPIASKVSIKAKQDIASKTAATTQKAQGK